MCDITSEEENETEDDDVVTTPKRKRKNLQRKKATGNACANVCLVIVLFSVGEGNLLWLQAGPF